MRLSLPLSPLDPIFDVRKKKGGIVVGNTPPAASGVDCDAITVSISYDPPSGNDVQFYGAASSTGGSIVSWDWMFGDGGLSTSQNPLHTYVSTPITAVLEVTDSIGNVCSVGPITVHPLTCEMITLGTAYRLRTHEWNRSSISASATGITIPLLIPRYNNGPIEFQVRGGVPFHVPGAGTEVTVDAPSGLAFDERLTVYLAANGFGGSTPQIALDYWGGAGGAATGVGRGSSGGGASWIEDGSSATPANSVLIVPGAGGGGYNTVTFKGGDATMGGGTAGGFGGGGGATTSAGGAGGVGSTSTGVSGGLYSGGAAGAGAVSRGSGGGGGGYYGGGGGGQMSGTLSQGGGGGSGYVDPSWTLTNEAPVTGTGIGGRCIVTVHERDPGPVVHQLLDNPHLLYGNHECFGRITYDLGLSGGPDLLPTGNNIPFRRGSLIAPNGDDRFYQFDLNVTTGISGPFAAAAIPAAARVPGPGSPWCIEAFVYRSTLSSVSGYIFSIGSNLSGNDNSFRLGSTGAATFANGATVVSSNNTVYTGTDSWHHILVGIDNSGNYKKYIDGVLTGTFSTAAHAYTPPASTAFRLAAWYDSGFKASRDPVACVAVYDSWWYTPDKVACRMNAFGL